MKASTCASTAARSLKWRRYTHGHEKAEVNPRGSRPGAQSPRWLGDDANYNVVHQRLRREQGRASDHTCPCGAQAQEWAFEEPTGYSTDLSKYTPMCIPCHRERDDNLGHKRRDA